MLERSTLTHHVVHRRGSSELPNRPLCPGPDAPLPRYSRLVVRPAEPAAAVDSPQQQVAALDLSRSDRAELPHPPCCTRRRPSRSPLSRGGWNTRGHYRVTLHEGAPSRCLVRVLARAIPALGIATPPKSVHAGSTRMNREYETVILRPLALAGF